jgi:hypothetical protein
MIYITSKQSKHITYDKSSYIQIYLVSWRRFTRERVSGPFCWGLKKMESAIKAVIMKLVAYFKTKERI